MNATREQYREYYRLYRIMFHGGLSITYLTVYRPIVLKAKNDNPELFNHCMTAYNNRYGADKLQYRRINKQSRCNYISARNWFNKNKWLYRAAMGFKNVD